jgi:hypothetical protein
MSRFDIAQTTLWCELGCDSYPFLETLCGLLFLAYGPHLPHKCNCVFFDLVRKNEYHAEVYCIVEGKRNPADL